MAGPVCNDLCILVAGTAAMCLHVPACACMCLHACRVCLCEALSMSVDVRKFKVWFSCLSICTCYRCMWCVVD